MATQYNLREWAQDGKPVRWAVRLPTKWVCQLEVRAWNKLIPLGWRHAGHMIPVDKGPWAVQGELLCSSLAVLCLPFHLIVFCLWIEELPGPISLCHTYSHTACVCSVQLFATPWTVACQAPLSMEFSRQKYWSGLPFPTSGDLSDPGIEPTSPESPALQSDTLPMSHLGSISLWLEIIGIISKVGLKSLELTGNPCPQLGSGSEWDWCCCCCCC